MRIIAEYAKPETIEVTISATMSVSAWRDVAEAIKQSDKSHLHAPSELRNAIYETITNIVAKTEVSVMDSNDPTF